MPGILQGSRKVSGAPTILATNQKLIAAIAAIAFRKMTHN
jgi:hypothetical protein